MKYICLNCGKEYESRKINSKFCCMECRREYYRIPYNCDYCGKEIFIKRCELNALTNGVSHHKFCSKDCANKGLNTSVINICECCGKEYLVNYSEKEIRKYCSVECYRKSQNKGKLETKICPVCNKQYETYHHNQIHCSKECASISQTDRVVCYCDNCGKKFERKRSEVDKATYHFCSKECSVDFHSWVYEDIEIMKKYYNKIPKDELQTMLSDNYSKTTINRKAISLGLTKSREWSENEDNILKYYYSNIPIDEVKKLLPNRSVNSIIDRGIKYGIKSYNYLKKVYSKDEIIYLQNNYLDKTNEELAQYLGRTAYAIEQKLRNLDLIRPCEINKTGYKNLNNFMRARLTLWKDRVRKENNYTCCITGSHSNLEIHHCRSFNLLMEETIDILEFEIKEDFENYNDMELQEFEKMFFQIQESYKEYVCVTKEIHMLFHKEYGFGDNTIEQWNEFVEKYTNKNLKDKSA